MIVRTVQRLAMAIRPRAIAGMILAIFVGSVVALPGVHWVIWFAGGGHGTTVPLLFLFGPTYLALRFFPSMDGRGPWDDFVLNAAMLGLYALYAAAITVGRRLSIGKQVVLAVLVFHYASISVLAAVRPDLSSYGDFTKLLGRAPFPQSFGLIEYYFLLHVAAVTFAVSRWPVSREGFKRTCIGVAIVTLVSFVYVAWAIVPSTH